MRIYVYRRAKGYEMLSTVDLGWENLARLNGKPVAKSWKPIRVQRVRVNQREGFRPSDSPYLGGYALVLRRSAVDALRDMLDAHGELLPLEDEGGVDLFAYNPRPIEALDHDRTQGSRDESERVVVPNNHVFFPSVVEGIDIFREARKRNAWIYLSERFLARWKQAKLKGLDFILAWDSDLPPEAQPNVWTSKPVKLSTIK